MPEIRPRANCTSPNLYKIPIESMPACMPTGKLLHAWCMALLVEQGGAPAMMKRAGLGVWACHDAIARCLDALVEGLSFMEAVLEPAAC